MEAIETKITLEETYDHSIERIWKAISDEKEIVKWFIQADFKPVVGYAYTFTHEQTVITGEVLVANPPSELTYTWCLAGGETTVRWTLEEVDGRTRVRIEHWGIESYADSAAQMFGAFKQGWVSCLGELSTYLGKDA